MDAITYLKEEHAKFRQTLTMISQIENISRKKLKFDALCKDLVRHETMEQKVFYPVLRKFPELQDILHHLLGEEKSAAETIKNFKKVSFDFMWKLRFYKFKHDVNHHAKEEEQELFPKVKKLLNKDELTILGKNMKNFKASLK
jgi:hemerythrin superfamily protein